MRNRIVTATSRVLLASVLLAAFATVGAEGLYEVQTAATKRVVQCVVNYTVEARMDSMKYYAGRLGSF